MGPCVWYDGAEERAANGLMGIFPALVIAAAQDPKQDCDDGDHQQDVDNRTCAIDKVSQRPCDDEDHCNRIQEAAHTWTWSLGSPMDNFVPERVARSTFSPVGMCI